MFLRRANKCLAQSGLSGQTVKIDYPKLDPYYFVLEFLRPNSILCQVIGLIQTNLKINKKVKKLILDKKIKKFQTNKKLFILHFMLYLLHYMFFFKIYKTINYINKLLCFI